MSDLYILIGSFFLIALIYSSVGFGGGSSYLALMAVMSVAVDIIRPAALLCNIVVVTGGAIIFYREGKVDWRSSWPFLVASVPLAYLGARIKLSDDIFFILLGATLVVASGFLWIQPGQNNGERSTNTAVNATIGGGIGFVSGLVSIGGGIFLSPILHLMKWGEAKKISALASLFILVNSVSGLIGQLTGPNKIDFSFILPLLIAVFFGGQIGSRLGAKTFNPLYIKRITAALILVAGVNILIDHL